MSEALHVRGRGTPDPSPAAARRGGGSGRTAPGPLRMLVGQLVHWMPVWVPLLMLWQVAQRGLAPALVERERLEGEELTVSARYRDSERSFELMRAEARAWTDPVYRERVRRLRAAEEREALAGDVSGR